MQQVIKELETYMFTIQTFDKDMAQDGDALHAYLVELTNIMARANLLMAQYQKDFRQKKRQVYLNLHASQVASNKYFAPSLAKDFVDAECYELGYVYDLSERLSRLCTHTLDAIRTIVSSLKSERQFAQYN